MPLNGKIYGKQRIKKLNNHSISKIMIRLRVSFNHLNGKLLQLIKLKNLNKLPRICKTLLSKPQKTYYNQATALAKAGQLKPAIDTYEKALKLSPQHEDALYNKKIVEQALQKNEQEQQEAGGEDEKQANSEQKQKDQEGQEQQQSGASEQKSNSSDKASKKSSDEQMNQDQQQKNKEQDEAKQQTEQEKQQAESEQDKENEGKTGQQQAEQELSDEQKQAQAQWLKRIPDDPAGLLERKFKYQYSQRNQASKQEKSW